MNKNLDIDTLPISVAVDPVEIVNGILDCYKNVKINQDIQETERVRIREYSRICIAQIEADMKKFEMQINQSASERMPLIITVCELMSKDIIDESTVKLCEMLLGYLSKNNSHMVIGQF